MARSNGAAVASATCLSAADSRSGSALRSATVSVTGCAASIASRELLVLDHEPCPHPLVAAHELGQRALERGHVERAADVHRPGEVVGGVVGGELVDQPQLLLDERAAQRPVTGRGGDRRRLPGGRLRLGGERLGSGFGSRAGSGSGGGAGAGASAGAGAAPCFASIASARSRIVGASISALRLSFTLMSPRTRATRRIASSEWPPASKKLSSGPPGARAAPCQMSARSASRPVSSSPAPSARGSVGSPRRPEPRVAAARSSLPLGVRGSSATHTTRRRDHVGGQLLRELGPHRLAVDVAAARVADDEGDQAPGLTVADREHGGLGDLGAALEDGRDLGRLDAVAADLDLPSTRPRNSSSPVGRRRPDRRCGTRALAVSVRSNTAFGRLLGVADVAARDPGATDHELPRDADGHRLAARVEDVARPRRSAADRHGRRRRALTGGPQLVGAAADVVSVGP